MTTPKGRVIRGHGESLGVLLPSNLDGQALVARSVLWDEENLSLRTDLTPGRVEIRKRA